MLHASDVRIRLSTEPTARFISILVSRVSVVEYNRIERALPTAPKFAVFPERLRGRYVAVDAERGQMRIEQVRDQTTRR